MKVISKEFEAAPKRKNENQGNTRFEFVMSSNAIDRHLERMDVKGIDYANFVKNPQAFLNHNSYRLPIGKWHNIRVQGDKLYGELEIHEETEEAKTVKKLLEKGYFNAVSIGFYSKKTETEPVPDNLKELARSRYVDNILIHRESELIETSLVSIPSNPEALRIKSIVEFNNNDLTESEMNFVHDQIKIGQVLSKTNKEKLRNAVNNINEVLESAEDDKNIIDYSKIENKLFNQLIK